MDLLRIFDRGTSRRRRKTEAVQQPKTLTLDLDGRAVEILVRRHARARNLSLRDDSKNDRAILVLPAKISERRGLSFVQDHRDWLYQQIQSLPDRIDFAPGTVIPYRGQPYRIAHDASRRYGVRLDEEAGILSVAGPLDHLPRRLRDHLKKQVKELIKPQVIEFSYQLGCEFGRITVRDQKTRWGSCSAKGDLSFNWRLIFAPPQVLRYVVAHEVAHIREHNHSPAFWAVVEELMPDMQDWRDWLKKEGVQLHRIG